MIIKQKHRGVKDEVALAFQLLRENQHSVHEVRIMAPRKNILSGYFNDESKLIDAIVKADGRYRGIYSTLNPTNPALLARAANRLKEYAANTTTDHDIAHRSRILIDIDADRPAGISSSNEEHELAIEKCKRVSSFLQENGFPEFALADSGNGGHLIGAVNLPNDENSRELIASFLEMLDAKFSDLDVKVDTTVSNAARITKLYGTWVKKGDSIPSRPHRQSQVLYAPDHLIPCPPEQISEITQRYSPVKEVA